MTTRSVAIRDATAADVQLIFRFIQSMAEFDGRRGALQATPDMIREGLFGVAPQASVLLAEVTVHGTEEMTAVETDRLLLRPWSEEDG